MDEVVRVNLCDNFAKSLYGNINSITFNKDPLGRSWPEEKIYRICI